MTSESLAENCTSTNSRDVTSHAKLIVEIAAKKLAKSGRKKTELRKLKQHGLVIGNLRIHVNVDTPEVWH